MAQVDVPQFLNWSEQPITWSRQDHSPRIEYPGRVALVVKPKVGDYWLPKTLMDGGSSINILYLDTFRRLRLPQSMVETTHTMFHGIVPHRKAYPIGKVTLPVTFGTPANFRTERIVFELVPFDSPYHCVLGRQAFAKFMAAPHYAYNAMKLPGPCGVITINGDPDMAAECEAKGAELADAVIAAEANHADELAKYASGVNNDDPTILKKPNSEGANTSAFEATMHTRTVELVPGDSSQTVTIGTGMSPA